MNREPSSSTLSRIFRSRSSTRPSPSPSEHTRSASDVAPGRPSISHPFALAPNTTLTSKPPVQSTSFTFTAPTPITSPIPVPLYRPSSASDFLERLSTFKLSTYRDKPTAIDAVAAARCGWRNEGGKDRLACNVCGAAWIVGNTTGMTREAGEPCLGGAAPCKFADTFGISLSPHCETCCLAGSKPQDLVSLAPASMRSYVVRS